MTFRTVPPAGPDEWERATRLSRPLYERLVSLLPSIDHGLPQYPCSVRFTDGTSAKRALLMDAEFRYHLSVWSDSMDTYATRIGVPIDRIDATPDRLNAEFANRIYTWDELAMGTFGAVLQMRQGSPLLFVPGNTVDYPDLPDGLTPSDIVAIRPLEEGQRTPDLPRIGSLPYEVIAFRLI